MFEPGTYEEVPLDGMRKTIAKRLTEAKQTVPHFYLTLDCELDALMALREQINAAAPKDKDGKPAYKLSVNDFVIKALAIALHARAGRQRQSGPRTASCAQALRCRRRGGASGRPVHAGHPQGRDRRRSSAISTEMKDFAGRASNRKLKPEEYQGGTTAVSNLGMFGIKDFTAVINPPQSHHPRGRRGRAARGRRKNGEPAVVQVMTVTLSCDHRVVDGALGAELHRGLQGAHREPDGDAGLRIWLAAAFRLHALGRRAERLMGGPPRRP